MLLKLKNLLKVKEFGFNIPNIVNIDNVKDGIYYAVRSNSCEEDGFLSNAGIFETRLFVFGIKNIKKAVREVTLNAGDCFIQEMVDSPDYSGVILLNNKEIVINVNNGLCEGITCGDITGYIYKFDKDLKIKKVFGSQEESMIFNGSKIVKIDSNVAKFDTSSIYMLKYAELAIQLSKLFNMNVDIEFSVKNGILYILQCRRFNS